MHQLSYGKLVIPMKTREETYITDCLSSTGQNILLVIISLLVFR